MYFCIHSIHQLKVPVITEFHTLTLTYILHSRYEMDLQ